MQIGQTRMSFGSNLGINMLNAYERVENDMRKVVREKALSDGRSPLTDGYGTRKFTAKVVSGLIPDTFDFIDKIEKLQAKQPELDYEDSTAMEKIYNDIYISAFTAPEETRTILSGQLDSLKEIHKTHNDAKYG